jgi:hypothetical protein
LPLPLAPPVTVIHASLAVAVQLQPEPAVTVAVAVPPLDAELCEVGDTP